MINRRLLSKHNRVMPGRLFGKISKVMKGKRIYKLSKVLENDYTIISFFELFRVIQCYEYKIQAFSGRDSAFLVLR